MRRTSLPGHALRSEGAAYVLAENDLRGCVDAVAGGREFTRCRGHVGCGLCECGAQSPPLHSNAARQRWHRDEHKPAVRAQMEAGRG